MASYKIGQKVKYKGFKTVITAINRDGTATLNYAPGSGKTGFAGTLPSMQKQIKIVSLEEILNSTSNDSPLVEKRLSIAEENRILLDLNDELDIESKVKTSGITLSRKLIDDIHNQENINLVEEYGKLPQEAEEEFISNLTSLFDIIDEDKNQAFSKETKIIASQLKEHYYDYQNIDENGNPKMLYDLDEEYPMLLSPKNLSIYSSLKTYADNGKKALPFSVTELAYKASSEAKANKKVKAALNEIFEEKVGYSPFREEKQGLISKLKGKF